MTTDRVVSTRWNHLVALKDFESAEVEVGRASLYVRDFTRRHELNPPDIAQRPSSIDDDYWYDLENAGWREADVNLLQSEDNVFPSKADVPWRGKDVDGDFSPTQLKQAYSNSSLAPIGSRLIAEQEARQSSFVADEDAPFFAVGPIQAMAHYAGRLFTSYDFNPTIDDSTKSSPSRVYFSKISPDELYNTDNSSEINPAVYPCFGDADPTSEFVNVPQETDGGYIDIEGPGQVLQMLTVRTSLMIITTAGIYTLSGQDLNTFSPLSFRIDKVSDAGGVSHFCAVEVEGAVFVWTDEGILVFTPADNSPLLAARNISNNAVTNVIRKANNYEPPATGGELIYDAIKTTVDVKAAYDKVNKVVKWLFREGEASIYYNRELCLDTELGAFYTNTYAFKEEVVGGFGVVDFVDTSTAFDFSGYFKERIADITRKRTTSSLLYVVLENGPPSLEDQEEFEPILHFCLPGALEEENKFLDYVGVSSADNEEAVPVYESNELTLGVPESPKDSAFVYTYMAFTEDGFVEDNDELTPTNQSGMQLTARFAFYDTDSSGKSSDAEQAYRLQREYMPEDVDDSFDYGQYVIVNKHKLRGRGKSLRIRAEGEPEKDCILFGIGLNLKVKEE